MRLRDLALVISAALPLAAAGGSLDDIRARGVLRVSVKNEGVADQSAHNDPAHFHKRGFEVELAGLIAEKILGDASKLDLKLFPRRQRLAAVADGTVDIGLSMFAVNAENRALVDFSESYYSGGMAVMQKHALTVNAVADLAGKRIVVLAARSHDPGGELQRIAAARGVTVQIVAVPDDFDAGIALLESGAVDGMAAANANLDAWIADGHPDYRRSPLLSEEHYAVAVRKGDTELLAIVNAVIAGLRASGRLDEMIAKWGLPAR